MKKVIAIILTAIFWYVIACYVESSFNIIDHGEAVRFGTAFCFVASIPAVIIAVE